MALTKNEIVTSVHELGFTKKKSVDIIETLLEIMKSTLEKGEDVLISGF
jgi:integration host factor subunit alpha